MSLRFDGHISTDDVLLDGNLQALDIVTMASGTYLYAATGQGGGVTSWRLEDGLAVEVDRAYFPNWVGGAAGGVVTGVEVGGTLQVVVGGGAAAGEGMLLGYQLGAQGQINALAQTGSLASGTWQISDVVSCGTSANMIYVADAATGQLVAYRPGTGGDYAPVQGQSVFDLGGVAELETIRVGTQNILLAASYGENGVVSYQIGSNGQLTEAGYAGAAAGLGIATPTALEVVTAFGQTWVVLAAAGSSSLSVMRLDETGALEPVEHLIDGLGTRFAGVQSLAVAQSGDRVFVVTGGADDGLSLFTLLPDGRLLHLQSIAQEAGLGLMNVGQISAHVQGDDIQVFVTSGVDAGISQFSISLVGLGEVLRDSGAGNTTLIGTNRDDVLEAGLTGYDTLRGNDGDDILLAGAGGADLWGGWGADHFVVSEGTGSQRVRVLDFQPGQDSLDLSDFSMLRNPGQLTVQLTSYGARLSFRDSVIEVHGLGGGPLTLSDIFGGGFSWPDRVAIIPLSPGDDPDPPDPGPTPPDPPPPTGPPITGGTGDDVLTGGDLADEIWAGAGDDTLSGGGSDDTIGGGSGNDVIYGGSGNDSASGGIDNDMLGGGSGNDTLDGEDGNDSLWGGAGNDDLTGGDGNDLLGGGDGDDVLRGNGGADDLYGGRDNDSIWGGTGNDLLGGFFGNDVLYGEQGNDAVWGADGNDQVWGGDGNDVVGGGNGNDTIHGDGGRDFLWGGRDNDVLYGGSGNDSLGSFFGDDALYGEGGSDVLWGNRGNDTLDGGGGSDTLNGGDDADTLIGGAQADTFVFGGTHGNDRVQDFEDGVDLLHIIGNGYTQFSQVTIVQSGDNAILRLTGGDVVIENTRTADLGADDFIFG